MNTKNFPLSPTVIIRNSKEWSLLLECYYTALHNSVQIPTCRMFPTNSSEVEQLPLILLRSNHLSLNTFKLEPEQMENTDALFYKVQYYVINVQLILLQT